MKKKIRKIVHVLYLIASMVISLLMVHYRLLYKKKKRETASSAGTKRNSMYLTITTQWVLNKQEGKTMDAFFTENEIKKVAIYGMGTMEELLYNELKNMDVDVSYFIDKNATNYEFMYDVITLDQMSNFEMVDAVIVTPVFAFGEIAEDVKKNADVKIVSLEELVYAMK